MVFSSMLFLWIFLPVTFVLSRIVRPVKLQNILLLVMSLIFYAWGEPVYVILLLVSVFANWLSGMLIASFPAKKKFWLFLAVAVNLSLLGYYKYANFAINTVNKVFRTSIPLLDLALPIGISFFTFQALSYVIDLYRGKYGVQKNILSLALYISFFPQLIAGPIVRYRDVNAQIGSREITPEKTAEGIRRFIYGLGKKVLIANVLAKAADDLYGLTAMNLTGGMAWFAAIAYTMQIYYDFSGYSDMAIGLGKMFGFDFLENFDLPYLSKSMGEFWRRWHMSLGTWFKEYLYIPLGGNRKGEARTCINLFIVFALTGLWHGASWNFVAWGVYNGVLVIAERLWLSGFLKKHGIASRLYTILAFIVGWVMFRLDSFMEAFRVLGRMFGSSLGQTMPYRLIMYVTPLEVFAMVCGILGAGVIRSVTPDRVRERFIKTPLEAVYLTLVFFMSIVFLAGNAYNPFIYFRF